MNIDHEARFKPSPKAWTWIAIVSMALGLLTLWAMSHVEPSTDSVLESCHVVGCDTQEVNGIEVFDPTPEQLTIAATDAQREQNVVNHSLGALVAIGTTFGLYALVVGEKRKQARRKRAVKTIVGPDRVAYLAGQPFGNDYGPDPDFPYW